MGESWIRRHRPSWSDWGAGPHVRLGPVIVTRQSCAGSAQPRIDGAMVVMTPDDGGEAQPARRQTFGGVALRLGDSLWSVGIRGQSMFPSWRLRYCWRRLRHPIASRRPPTPMGVSMGGDDRAMADTGPRAMP